MNCRCRAPAPDGNLGVNPLTGETITQGVGSSGQIVSLPGNGTIDQLLGFVQKYPLLAYGAVQAGGSLLSGLTSTLTPAQVGALNAQAAANQAAANQQTLQTQNLQQPRSTATLAPVTGRPNTIITPPTAGLINGAPSVNITGAPTT